MRKKMTVYISLLLIACLAGNASAVIVAAYDFEGNFNDVSGYGTPANATQAGTLVGGDLAQIVNDSVRGDVLSLANGAALKIGPRNNSHGNAGHPEKLDFVNAAGYTGAYSMGAWIKTSTMGDLNYVIALGQGSGARMGQLGEDGQTAGVRGAWTTLNTSGSTWDGPTIGAKPYFYDYGNYTGLIDDVFFANHAMSESEIQTGIMWQAPDFDDISADAGGPYEVAPSGTVVLDGSASWADHSIELMKWSIDGQYVGEGQTLSVTYDTLVNTMGLGPGIHEVGLMASIEMGLLLDDDYTTLEIIPEPATILLFALSGLLLRKKSKI